MGRVDIPHQSCRGLCIEYKATKPRVGSRYSNGQKRCQLCVKFITWEGSWCPCCGYRLRTRPRIRKYKEMLKLARVS